MEAASVVHSSEPGPSEVSTETPILNEYTNNRDEMFSDSTCNGKSPGSSTAPSRRPRVRLWEEPMGEDCEEKWSEDNHMCPICGSLHRATGYWQHLRNVHGKSLAEAGRWILCTACGRNFANEISWRSHAKETECTLVTLQIRWRERMKNGDDTPQFEMQMVKRGRKRKMIEAEKREEEIVRKKFTSRSKEGETEEEARERKQKCLMMNRTYMQPRSGWKIVRQMTSFKCPVCQEGGFPTIPSLVWHERTEHKTQLCDTEHWIHCSGCEQDFASLSSIRVHIKEATAAGISCGWQTTSISWQVEEGTEEQRRFASGLPPLPFSAAAAPAAASPSVLQPFLSASLLVDGVKEEPMEEGEWAETMITAEDTVTRHRHNARVDKNFMLPRLGFVIIRRQTELVCQLCGERGFVTCSSLDHHMRKTHKSGFHLAEMWMHCARCLANFANMTSVRSHVKEESCSWDGMFMCWHERERAKGGGENESIVVKSEFDGDDWPVSTNNSATTSFEEPTFTPSTRRFRKLFKPPEEAAPGYEIVKRIEDLPCFGCEMRCPSITTFISHMQGKHRLYFSDIGAWLECPCGRQFTSTTAARMHVREQQDESTCSIRAVVLCWQRRVGGGEKETPAGDFTPGCSSRTAACSSRSIADSRESSSRDESPVEFDLDVNTLLMQPKEEIVDEDEKEEEGNGKEKEEIREEAMREDGRAIVAAFNPSRFNAGDIFVLRKSAVMSCAVCKEDNDGSWLPHGMTMHLREEHGEDLRSLQQWLECVACCTMFHSASAHLQHLRGSQSCSMADVRMCWMELLRSVNE